ncbi:hypothetical protein SKAU_G00040610 [Synaphobranchus kaupii]|uniref:Tetraspanin 8 n=1 Tax=Synaphobranchus kaupii TaxID=118154 RepID=A0A9Q1G1F7_SYNKA|nr:hypothetical protein SKAU_G00040610 [Synaphobranchus kaupii]
MAVSKCIKYCLFLFNLLFWISGCIILGVSIYIKVSKDSNQITKLNIPGVDLLIAIGVIIMVLGFLGCCGAIKENKCMLLLFFIGLLIIFILLLAAGILGAVGEDKVVDWVKDELKALLPLSNQPESTQKDLQNPGGEVEVLRSVQRSGRLGCGDSHLLRLQGRISGVCGRNRREELLQHALFWSCCRPNQE